jgi:hypothetical protein
VGWNAGGTTTTTTTMGSTTEGGQRNERHTTRPSLTSNCSWGGSRVERRQEARRHEGEDSPAPAPIAPVSNATQRTTTQQGGQGRAEAGKGRPNDNPAPAPTLASHCSQGGTRVLTSTSPASTNDRGGQGRVARTNATQRTTTRHPPPALRATARRVDRGC